MARKWWARVMDQRPATIKRNVKNGVLTSHWGDGRHTFDARDVQFYMLRKGRGSVPLNVVEQLLEAGGDRHKGQRGA